MTESNAGGGRRIVVSGATGLVGSALVEALAARGDVPVRIVRHARQRHGDDIVWAMDGAPLPAGALDGADAVVHLAGETIGERWSAEKKRAIRDSRVGPTRQVAEAVATANPRPRVLVVASAVGIYGDRGDEILNDASAPGTGFLADVAQAWEGAAEPARAAGVRTVHARFGMILSPKGGALDRMLPIFKLGAGGALGDGDQWWSWIALPDVVRAILFAIDRDVNGAVNVTSPFPVTNQEFTDTLASVLHRPAIAKVPAFALRLAFADMADDTLLASARVVPERLTAAGFQFEHPRLEEALRALLAER